jgi:hypothetical protein
MAGARKGGAHAIMPAIRERSAGMKIMIGTPAYNGQVTTAYVETLLRLLDHFRARRPQVQFETRLLTSSILPFLRNLYASLVLEDDSYTHLLFVDADMGFSPALVERMLDAGKPVVGVMSPHRALDLTRLYALKDQIDDPNVARLVAIDYVNAGSVERSGDAVKMQGALLRVRRTGAGVMLIRRGALETMKAQFPNLWCERIAETYARFGLKTGVLQCFEPMPDEHGLYGGEDAAFCRRWVEGCGGEIWAVATETIVHVGPEKFVGHYATKLRHGRI